LAEHRRVHLRAELLGQRRVNRSGPEGDEGLAGRTFDRLSNRDLSGHGHARNLRQSVARADAERNEEDRAEDGDTERGTDLAQHRVGPGRKPGDFRRHVGEDDARQLGRRKADARP